jgi:hypothetical protein
MPTSWTGEAAVAERRKLGGKKPVHLVAAGGFLTARDRIWAAIRARRTRFTRPDIAFDTKAPEHTVRSYFDLLLQAGYLRPLEHKPRSEHSAQFRYARYELVRDVGAHAPRLRPDGSEATLGRKQEQLWQAVKILREFDARQLTLTVRAAQCPVSFNTVKTYVQALARAGYLVCAGRGKHNVGWYRFVGSMNTGPRPPVLQNSGDIFDPNLGEVVWPR